MAQNEQITLTNDLGILTMEQRRFYETNGYIIMRKFVPLDLLKKCSQRFDDLASKKVEGESVKIIFDVTNRKTAIKAQNLHLDEIFRQYIENKDILDIVQSFTGPNITAIHTMLIVKPPDNGSLTSRHPPHQDLCYFPIRPEDQIVGAWTAIEPCNKMNGCLFVAPGSHISRYLYKHDYPSDSSVNNAFYYGINDLPKSLTWIDLEMEPGDIVFFHPNLIHGSGINRTTQTRKAISCHYAASECHYIDIKGTNQETLGQEVLKSYQSKNPLILNYQHIWELKASLVRGVRLSI